MVLLIIILSIVALYIIDKMFFELEIDFTKDVDEKAVVILFYYWRGVRECKLIKINV